MSNSIRPHLAVATLILFLMACGSGPTEVATENNSEVVTENNNETEEIVQSNADVEGSIAIAELVNNAESFAGKTVQVTGTCTKINTGIMGHNWIHLIDGSKDDFDLVITSDALVTVGNVVTMKGVVAINKDFGAGYSYELIIEEGVVVE